MSTKNNKICPTCGDEFVSDIKETIDCNKCLSAKESSNSFELRINVPMIKELVSDKIYQSDASAFREQYVNALSHGCIAYHDQHGYTDEVFVHVLFDYGKREVIIRDNGQGMTKKVFSNNFMSFGFSTVSKDKNNSRSGMFGLGAISFFRIASACIVESWNRDTEDHFRYMTRNTDESEFLPKVNWELEGYGTMTKISLKPNVKMQALVEKVKEIAENYPVKTVLEVINAEQEQNISSYEMEDEDIYTEFPAVHSFVDYVKKMTNDKYTKIIDNDELELYASTTGGNRNKTFLCRVPIGISYTTGFTTFLNIKKEKIDGEDSKGNFKLKEVPKPDRDQVNEEAEEYFSNLINKSVDDMIYDIKINSYQEFLDSESRWILSGYAVDDKLNSKTHRFIQKLREPVRYRDVNGIQKRNETILGLLGTYKSIFVHPSLHKGTFLALHEWHKKNDYKDYEKAVKLLNAESAKDKEPEEILIPYENYEDNWNKVCFIDHTQKGLPILEAKAFKKSHMIPAVSNPTRSNGNASIKGLLVRSGTWNNQRITTDNDEEIQKQYPGGIYYGDGILGQWNITNINSRSLSEQGPFMNNIMEKSKSGIVVAKTGKKSLPSIKSWVKSMVKKSNEGKIISIEEGPITLSASTGSTLFNEHAFKDSNMTLLPLSCSNMGFLKYMTSRNIILMPYKDIYTTYLTHQHYFGNWEYVFLNILGKIPMWNTIDEQILGHVMDKVAWMHKSYSPLNNDMLAEMVMYIIGLKMNTDFAITEVEYNRAMSEIADKYETRYYQVRWQFSDMFPERYLSEKAAKLGYKDTEKVEGDNTKLLAYADTICDGEFIPMEIKGKMYSVYNSQYIEEPEDTDDKNHDKWVEYNNTHEEHDLNEQDLNHFEAIIDDKGIARIVEKFPRNTIVHKDGKLKYIREVTQWD